jgi:hypothetical protein
MLETLRGSFLSSVWVISLPQAQQQAEWRLLLKAASARATEEFFFEREKLLSRLRAEFPLITTTQLLQRPEWVSHEAENLLVSRNFQRPEWLREINVEVDIFDISSSSFSALQHERATSRLVNLRARLAAETPEWLVPCTQLPQNVEPLPQFHY